MKSTIITGTLAAAGLIAVVSFTGCTDKSTPVVTPPTSQQAPAQQVTGQPTGQQPVNAPVVPRKVDLKAQPGRNIVITDLKVQGADGSTPTNVQLNTPLRIRSAKSNDATPGTVTPETETNARLLKNMQADKADAQKK